MIRRIQMLPIVNTKPSWGVFIPSPTSNRIGDHLIRCLQFSAQTSPIITSFPAPGFTPSSETCVPPSFTNVPNPITLRTSVSRKRRMVIHNHRIRREKRRRKSAASENTPGTSGLSGMECGPHSGYPASGGGTQVVTHAVATRVTPGGQFGAQSGPHCGDNRGVSHRGDTRGCLTYPARE